MAFEKKPLQDGVKIELKDYSVDLEDRIDDGFDEISQPRLHLLYSGFSQGQINIPTIKDYKWLHITISISGNPSSRRSVATVLNSQNTFFLPARMAGSVRNIRVTIGNDHINVVSVDNQEYGIVAIHGIK